MTKGVHGTGILSVLVLAFAKVLPRLTTARADVDAKERVGEHTRHHDQLDGARLTATIVRCALGHTHLPTWFRPYYAAPSPGTSPSFTAVYLLTHIEKRGPGRPPRTTMARRPPAADL